MAMNRVLITGAAGALGKQLRQKLKGVYPVLRFSDIAAMDAAEAGEEVMQCDLIDAAAVEKICEGVDGIVHLGGQAVEADWPRILQANLIGAINLYEGARKAGVDRMLFASSNHAVGFWPRAEHVDHTAVAKPDSRYGLSKAFGEDLSRFYANKHGIRGFNMRIGSCFPEPVNKRMLSTWLSYADFAKLCQAGLDADYHYEVVYGISRNTRAWWDNSNAYRLGYAPLDDAEDFAARVGHIVSDDPLEETFVGGNYLKPDFSGDFDRIS